MTEVRHTSCALAMVCLLAIDLAVRAATSNWPTDPNQNLAITTVPYDHNFPQIVPDGSGGAVIVWASRQAGSISHDIYAQRAHRDGGLLWRPNGQSVCRVTGGQGEPAAIPDGEGGAIIAWHDGRNGSNGDIYVQHMSGGGVALWNSNGVAVCTAANHQLYPRIASDGLGGAIIIWSDYRSDPDTSDVYAQRVDASGNVVWTLDGVPVCVAKGNQSGSVVSDGAGGAIVSWEDEGTTLLTDIYAQRLDPDGVPLWNSDGVPVATGPWTDYAHQIVSDGAGGAIVTWVEWGGVDIYAQRIDPNGEKLWALQGAPVCVTAGWQENPQIATDGASGAVICWEDSRPGSASFDIYANRIDSDGNVLWATNGIPVCSEVDDQESPMIIQSDDGETIIAWRDLRAGFLAGSDIYAQKLDTDGNLVWSLVGGVAVATAPNTQWMQKLVSDGQGGAIITWHDQRDPDVDHVYAQQVGANGNLGELPTGIGSGGGASVPALTVNSAAPNPFGTGTEILFELRIPGEVTFEIFDVNGRQVFKRRIGQSVAGLHRYFFDARDASARPLTSGVYFYRLSAGSEFAVGKLVLAH